MGAICGRSAASVHVDERGANDLNKLLADAIDAHGRLERWKKFITIEMDVEGAARK